MYYYLYSSVESLMSPWAQSCGYISLLVHLVVH